MRKIVAILLISNLFCGCAGLLIQRQTNYINAHPEMSQEKKQAILKGHLILGMTKEEVIASIGDTDKKSQSSGLFGTSETWTYGDCSAYTCALTYVNFSGDKLISVNTSKS